MTTTPGVGNEPGVSRKGNQRGSFIAAETPPQKKKKRTRKNFGPLVGLPASTSRLEAESSAKAHRHRELQVPRILRTAWAFGFRLALGAKRKLIVPMGFRVAYLQDWASRMRTLANPWDSLQAQKNVRLSQTLARKPLPNMAWYTQTLSRSLFAGGRKLKRTKWAASNVTVFRAIPKSEMLESGRKPTSAFAFSNPRTLTKRNCFRGV